MTKNTPDNKQVTETPPSQTEAANPSAWYSNDVDASITRLSEKVALLGCARSLTRLELFELISRGKKSIWIKNENGKFKYIRVTAKRVKKCIVFNIPEFLTENGWGCVNDPLLKEWAERMLRQLDLR